MPHKSGTEIDAIAAQVCGPGSDKPVSSGRTQVAPDDTLVQRVRREQDNSRHVRKRRSHADVCKEG